jgi:signal transduction histidine kinase
MKKILFFVIGLSFLGIASAQNMDVLQVDRLRAELAAAKHDTTRSLLMSELAEAYRSSRPDSTYFFGNKALELAQKNDYALGKMRSYVILSHYYYNLGDLSRALDLGLRSLELARGLGTVHDQAFAMIRVGNVYAGLKDGNEALRYFRETQDLTRNTSDSFFYVVTYWRMADVFRELNMIDSTLVYGIQAEKIAKGMNNNFIQSGVAPSLGYAYGVKGNDSLALHYLRKSPGLLSKLYLSEFYKQRGVYDSALFYADNSYQQSVKFKVKQTEYRAALILSSLYEKTDLAKALYYHKVAMAVVDSVYGSEKVMAAQSVAFQMEERKRQLELAEINWRNQVRTWIILLGLGAIAAIAFILFRNNRREKEVNRTLNLQKAEISKTLNELKATQTQLIHAEKMASLGELTAGIAHEIQNPLNFVNNFSELNRELIDDLGFELQKGDIREATSLLSNLKENEAKINLHGKRADSIVKSMLQHSRAGSGVKEMTDINKLVDEYVRLAYHGYRAKDKNFNVQLDLDLDTLTGSILMVKQDIGRVLLNILNNAFYAVVQQKQKVGDHYKPIISISTKREGNSIDIRVQDNGPGIPADKKDKIFQPFFTTKPTGEGTGLGLSLSYDIITQGYGGSLECISSEGQGAAFQIRLPVV